MIFFSGMFLTDLNFIEAKNSEGIVSGMSVMKNVQAENVVCKIKWFQHSNYGQ